MNWGRDLLLENWLVKLIALILAFILWLAVHGDLPGERIIAVPLEVRNVPPRMVITSDRPTSVELTVRGALPPNVWFTYTAPPCIIDLAGVEAGEHIIPLSAKNVHIPRAAGFEVLAVQPPRLRLVLEPMLSKQVPIHPTLDLKKLDSDLELYAVTPNPNTVLISGPRSRVEPITAVETEPIPVEGSHESSRVLANLNLTDARIQSSQLRPVEVQIDIGPRRRLLVITQVPVVADEASVTVAPTKVAVQLMVPITYNRKLTSADFVVTAPVRALDPKLEVTKVKPEVHPTVPLEPGTVVKEVIPPMITVRRNAKS
jgi:YbbR domain-containing protein